MDLANGFLRWYLAIRKAVDEQRCPTGPSAWACNRDKFGDKIVRIIRKRFQIVAR